MLRLSALYVSSTSGVIETNKIASFNPPVFSYSAPEIALPLDRSIISPIIDYRLSKLAAVLPLQSRPETSAKADQRTGVSRDH